MKVKIKKSVLMNEDTSQEDLIKCANDFVTAVTNLGNAQSSLLKMIHVVILLYPLGVCYLLRCVPLQ